MDRISVETVVAAMPGLMRDPSPKSIEVRLFRWGTLWQRLVLEILITLVQSASQDWLA